jgi:hypothetical protein
MIFTIAIGVALGILLALVIWTHRHGLAAAIKVAFLLVLLAVVSLIVAFVFPDGGPWVVGAGWVIFLYTLLRATRSRPVQPSEPLARTPDGKYVNPAAEWPAPKDRPRS